MPCGLSKCAHLASIDTISLLAQVEGVDPTGSYFWQNNSNKNFDERFPVFVSGTDCLAITLESPCTANLPTLSVPRNIECGRRAKFFCTKLIFFVFKILSGSHSFEEELVVFIAIVSFVVQRVTPHVLPQSPLVVILEAIFDLTPVKRGNWFVEFCDERLAFAPKLMEFLPVCKEVVNVAVMEEEDGVVGSGCRGGHLAANRRVQDAMRAVDLFVEFGKIFGFKCRSRSVPEPFYIDLNLSSSCDKLFACLTV